MNWKAGTAVALASATVGLGGCVAFDGDIEGKQVSKDAVQIKFALCSDNNGETCEDIPREARRGDTKTRVLLAFRAPKGTGVPESFEPLDYDVKFKPSASYSKQLAKKAPTKNSEQWYGYISNALAADERGPAHFRLRFGLPDKPGKVFRYRPVVGYQETAVPNAKVRCGPDIHSQSNDNDALTNCADDPGTPEELAENLKINLD